MKRTQTTDTEQGAQEEESPKEKKPNLQDNKSVLVTEATLENFEDYLDRAKGRSKLLVCHMYRKEACEPFQQSLTDYPDSAAVCQNDADFIQMDLNSIDSKSPAYSIIAENEKESPFFVIFKDGKKIDSMKGFNPWELQSKIKKNSGKSFQYGNISNFMKTDACECLNASDETPFEEFLLGKTNLVSDCDEQLLLIYGFNQRMKLHSIKIKAPVNRGPKTLKLFVNQTKSLGFDDALSFTPAQTITLSEEDLKGEKGVEVHTVKFQNIVNLQIFVVDNLGEEDITEISSITLIGAPLIHGKMIQGGTYTIEL